MKRITLIYILALVAMMATAQKKDYPIENREGTPCYRYQVQRGEGLYRISLNFGVTQEELIRFNPELQNTGLKYDQIIYIPVVEEINQDTYVTHIIEQGETLYGLSRKYGVSVEELQRLNPVVSKRMAIGETLYIKPKAAQTATPAKAEEAKPAKQMPIPTMNTAPKAESPSHNEAKPILPVVQPVTEVTPADTTPEEEEPTVLDSLLQEPRPLRLAFFIPINTDAPKRDMNNDRFVYFYEGALLAIREMQIAGQALEVHFIDNGAPTFRLGDALRAHGMDSLDAIIGHFSAENMEMVSPFCRQHHCMLLIPFSNKVDSINNPYVMQFNPTMPKGQKANMFHSETDNNWSAFTQQMKHYFKEKELDKQPHRYDLLGYDLTIYLIRALAQAQNAATENERQAAFETVYQGLQSDMKFIRQANGGYINTPIEVLNVTTE